MKKLLLIPVLLFAVALAIVTTSNQSAYAQAGQAITTMGLASSGSGAIVLQNGATLNTPSISFLYNSGTYASAPFTTGTGAVVIASGSVHPGTTLSGTLAVTGASVGERVSFKQPTDLASTVSIYGNVTASGTVVGTIATLSGTTVIPSGTYPLIVVTP